MIIKTTKNKKLKFGTVKNSTESDETKVLVPHSLSNSSSNKYDKEEEEDEDEDEGEEELNFEKLYLDSIGIYTVLEYALLGSLRCYFKGFKRGLNDDHKNDRKSVSMKNKSNSNCNETEVVSDIENKNLDDETINNTTSLPSTLPLPLPLSVDNNCLYCGLVVLNNTRCARCKLPYCGREHQRLHWTVHKVRTCVI